MQNTLKTCLKPPGQGIFTVNQNHNPQNNSEKWEADLGQIENSRSAIIALPSDSGGGICRGAAWGPQAIRERLYESLTPELDLGDILVNPHLLMDDYLNKQTIKTCQQAMFDGEPYPVSPLSLAEFVMNEIYQINPNIKIMALGGDHSCSFPFVKSTLRHYQQMGKRIGLVHFDAHTDLLDERMGIDICFGSWTSHALKYLTEPGDCIQIGIRASGKSKEYWEGKFGLKQFYMADVNEAAILEYLASRNLDGVYITFDIDAIDANHVSATGTPEKGGLHPEQCYALIDKIKAQYPLVGADLMEVAPFIAREILEHEPASTLEIGSKIAKKLVEGFR